MQIAIKVLIGVMLLILGLVVFAPKDEKIFLIQNRPALPHTYYYYPKANFYYDSTDSQYILWDSTKAGWTETNELPLQEDDLGKKVRLGHAAEPVWKENQQHRLIYSVSLYSDPEDFKTPKKVEAEKPNVAGEPEEVQKKTGLKKFIERIFPPKKKKDS
jgi:hypothetical protein